MGIQIYIHTYLHTYIHTIHTYHTYIPYIHTIHTYHTYIPYIHTIHTYHPYILKVHPLHGEDVLHAAARAVQGGVREELHRRHRRVRGAGVLRRDRADVLAGREHPVRDGGRDVHGAAVHGRDRQGVRHCVRSGPVHQG